MSRSGIKEAAKPGVGDQEDHEPSPIPASVTLARRGIRTFDHAIEFQSALAGDIMDDQVKPGKANAALRAVEGMAKMFELKQKYCEGKNSLMAPATETPLQRRLELLEAELKELRAAGC